MVASLDPVFRLGLAGVRASGPSRVSVSGEFATSRPQLGGAGGQAYLESFEGEGGLQPQLLESRWYYGSAPAPSPALDALGGAGLFTLERAAALAWQNNGRRADGSLVSFTFEQIDPAVVSVGGGVALPEPTLWLTLLPLDVGGLFRDGELDRPGWRIPDAPAGRRWRSLHTALGPTGADLTRVEAIEFWTLVDLDAARRDENPTLVIDLGEVSENSLTFAPASLRVGTGLNGRADSTYRGKVAQGQDRLDSELDPFSRTFNQARNDRGLAGDVVDRITVVSGGDEHVVDSLPLCVRGTEQVFRLGDPRANCTVRNNRGDTEDLDEDQVLNLDRASLGAERIRRYVVDLGDPVSRTRLGRCGVQVDVPEAGLPSRQRCWVQVRIPFNAPSDSLNGGPPLRRVQAMRLTLVSGAGAPDGQRVQIPIVRLRLVGAPWLKRDDRTARGIAGAEPGVGQVVATVIGTQDRDSLAGIFYESPPGVTDEPEQRQTGLESGRLQVNERSLRLQAVGMAPHERAEAYVRFPEGEKSFLGYRQLRLWARGRGDGWGPGGELQFFVKMGRDADNFYLYRTTVNAGPGRAAWEPEVRVDLRRFSRLRARLEQLFLEQPGGALACSGVDSALVAGTPRPAGSGPRFAVCEDGYVVYTVSPAVSPPNLAAVQELAVGMVRLPAPATGGTLLPGDTLELWVNDLRLDRVENEPGYAGQLTVALSASDVADLSLSMTRRDPFFRQLAELPSFRTDDALEGAATVRLDRFLPERFNLALPVSVRFTQANVDPLFVSDADYEAAGIRGLRTPRAHSPPGAASRRRARPVGGGGMDVLLAHPTLDATLTDAATRTEFQTGAARQASAELEYAVVAAPRTTPLPGWVDALVARLPAWLENSAGARALRDAVLRWNPAELRLTTGLSRATDTRTTYLRLAESPLDPGSDVSGESFLWRSGGTLAFRPLGGLAARLDLTSVRDLRRYGDSTAAAIAAERARGSLFGTDVGFERERYMTGTLTLAPVLASWLRPRAELRARFDLLRDPNRQPVLLPGAAEDVRLLAVPLLDSLALDSLVVDPLAVDPRTGLPYAALLRLPRRLGNERVTTTGAALDYAAALRAYGDTTTGVVRWLSGTLQPLDVSLTRSARSAYDASPFSPGLGFQLGLGGIGDFRHLGGVPATSAGEGTQFAATQALSLPAGVALVARLTRSQARTWTRQPFTNDPDG
jgi:hypothetical protein